MENDELNSSRKSTSVRKKKTDFMAIGKKPPYDDELEQIVLGALMLEKNALTEVVELLKPDTFYRDKHQAIFTAIRSLFSKSEPIDLMTVTGELKATGELEATGGPLYIAQLTQKVNSAANIVYHSRLLLQYSIKRELISISNTILRDAFEETTDVFELLDTMEQSLFEVSEMNIKKNYDDMQSLMVTTLAELDEMRKHKDGLTGVPSGFTQLDRVTSGWQRSDLVIVAARPAMGKTAFVLSLMRNAAVDHNKGVAIFSLEMASSQLVKRLISAEAEIESEKLKTGKLSDFEWQQLVSKTAKITQSPIFIDDTPAISILELRAKCRRLKAQHDIQMIIIDYLQLMTGDTKGKGGGNREQEIASISRALKQIAKELNVPVIALSQLSRAVETRGGDKRPQLSDLRESGSIEQDADMVIFLYRPEYYGITEDENGNPVTGLGEVIIAKHRNGSLEDVPLKFIGKFTKFTDWQQDPFISSGDFGGNMGFGPGETITLGSKINDNRDLGKPPSAPRPEDEEPPF